jgi:hypothetical protein
MFDKTKQMELGDLFSNTFKLFKETFSRNIVIASAFLVPAGILMTYGFDSFFSALMETVRTASENRFEYSEPDYTFIFSNIGIYVLSLLAFLLGYLGAMIGITRISCRAAEGERISIGEAFNKVFSVLYLRCIGQSFLLSLAVSACFFAGIMIIIIGSAAEIVLITVIGVLALIGGIVLMIYLSFRWYFAFVAIVGEDKKVIESFSKSSFLVEGNWWRTFGIVLLFSVLVDFAISIITTPVYFIVMWDFISQYFKMMAEGNINEKDPEVIFGMMESFGFAFGVVIIITTILDALITPLFNVVYYFDLKIRKKDFPETISPDNLPGGIPPVEQY